MCFSFPLFSIGELFAHDFSCPLDRGLQMVVIHNLITEERPKSQPFGA